MTGVRERSSARRWAVRTCMIAACFAAPARTARANDSRIAIESHIGARPAEAAKAMTYLGAALERWSFTAKPAALAKQLGDHAVSPGLADPRFTAQTFSKQVEAGLNAVVNEQFRLAARLLVAALDSAHRNSLVLARDPKSREARLEALIYLARSYKHLGKTAERDEVMTEVLRSYPGKAITANKYGPDAEAIYNAVKRTIDRGGRGWLTVEVSDPEAVIYVDEIVRGRGKTSVGGMLPGPHRVLIDGANGAARQYRVAVRANQRTQFAIDWEVDSMLVTGGWVGFQLPTEKDREREGMLARRLADDRTQAVMIAVLSATRIGRRTFVTGTLHAVVSGRVARSGRIELTGWDDTRKLEQLAAFLGFQNAGKEVTVLELSPPEIPPFREPGPPRACPCTCSMRSAGDRARAAPAAGGRAKIPAAPPPVKQEQPPKPG